MNPIRTLALLAFPAALSLAACGGGSTGVSNAIGLQSQLRFVNGAPGTIGADVDVYYTSTGGTASPRALIQGLSYGAITDFNAMPVVAAQVLLRTANTTTVLGSCSIPQPANNEIDTLVIVNSGVAATPLTCTEFMDSVYSAPGQYRVHHAAVTAAATNPTFSFGLTNGVAAATFMVVGTATFPGTFNSNPQLAASPVAPSAAVGAGPVGFAVGMNAQPGSTMTTVAQINASQFVFPGTGSQPDTADTLPGGGFNNGSIFIIDCTTATTSQGSACASGIGLIGSFDTK